MEINEKRGWLKCLIVLMYELYMKDMDITVEKAKMYLRLSHHCTIVLVALIAAGELEEGRGGESLTEAVGFIGLAPWPTCQWI
jgi:hypothetical protein